MKDLKNYDLSLGKWGPYNKDYLGIAHIADEDRGATFQVELFPGLFRRSIFTCRSVVDNGVKMWGANARLDRFCYRYELEWKDRVYCDAEFTVSEDKFCTITCTFHNHTETAQSVNLNLCAGIHYPTKKNGAETVGYLPIRKAVCPEDTLWIDAVDYDDISCTCEMPSDGKYLGEEVMDGATGKGTAIGHKYFSQPDHYLKYNLAQLPASGIGIRYKAEQNTQLTVIVNGTEYKMSVPASHDFSYIVSKITPCNVEEILIRPCGEPVTIDSIMIGKSTSFVDFIPTNCEFEPQRIVEDNRLYLTYPGIKDSYSIEWDLPLQRIRLFHCEDIGDMLSKTVHNHAAQTITSMKESRRVYENLLSNPLYLAPGERAQLTFYVQNGPLEELMAAAKTEKTPIDSCVSQAQDTQTDCSMPSIPAPIYDVTRNSDGEAYAFSQNMMMYNTFLNVVYPIYTRRRYIRHNTPGRNWDSLYSWDSGFIGMGLATADFTRAYECLNTYLTPVGDMHSPYIFHGSVVPTQIFLYQMLFEKYPQQRESLAKLYPMVKQYYEFYAHLDQDAHQTGSGLLKTWHIFYNSGGWDDYPPQHHLRECKDRQDVPNYDTVTPAITTSCVVLIARIMKQLAMEFGFHSDVKMYDEHIAKYSALILKYLWDDEVGYYSYMVHDENGNPKDFYRYEDGTNYNRGFDGIYPMIAGICDDYHKSRILENVRNGLMTDIGVGVVDKRAPYYTPYGYWNGSVWMPHQWILWKSLLDNGDLTLAQEIAIKALKLWSDEVQDSYCCFEHFMSTNGRGAGFHQFSGLSTPVLMFYEAYYKPGTVTSGFFTSLKKVRFNEDKTAAAIHCMANGNAPIVLICLKEGNDYSIQVNGVEASAQKLTNGARAVTLPVGECIIEVSKKNS